MAGVWPVVAGAFAFFAFVYETREPIVIARPSGAICDMRTVLVPETVRAACAHPSHGIRTQQYIQYLRQPLSEWVPERFSPAEWCNGRKREVERQEILRQTPGATILWIDMRIDEEVGRMPDGRLVWRYLCDARAYVNPVFFTQVSEHCPVTQRVRQEQRPIPCPGGETRVGWAYLFGYIRLCDDGPCPPR